MFDGLRQEQFSGGIFLPANLGAQQRAINAAVGFT
jgi:hypothetical protein